MCTQYADFPADVHKPVGIPDIPASNPKKYKKKKKSRKKKNELEEGGTEPY
jgi:hypothetical protein